MEKMMDHMMGEQRKAPLVVSDRIHDSPGTGMAEQYSERYRERYSGGTECRDGGGEVSLPPTIHTHTWIRD